MVKVGICIWSTKENLCKGFLAPWLFFARFLCFAFLAPCFHCCSIGCVLKSLDILNWTGKMQNPGHEKLSKGEKIDMLDMWDFVADGAPILPCPG